MMGAVNDKLASCWARVRSTDVSGIAMRSVIDSHPKHGVYFPKFSMAILCFVLIGLLSYNVYQRSGQVSQGTRLGRFDENSYFPPVPVQSTPVQITSSLNPAPPGIPGQPKMYFSYTIAANLIVITASDCATIASNIFGQSGTPSYAGLKLSPMTYAYSFVQPGIGCQHAWAFGSNIASIPVNVNIVAFGVTGSTACPTFGHTSGQLRADPPILTSTWPFFTCVLLNNSYADPVVVRSDSTRPLDSYCWAGDRVGSIIPQVLANEFEQQCRSSFQNVTCLNSFRERTSILDAVGLTFSTLSLAFTITAFVLKLVNYCAEKKYGRLPIHEDKQTHDVADEQQSAYSAPLLQHANADGVLDPNSVAAGAINGVRVDAADE